jgi:ABC-type ATPase involved in cell division
VLYICKEFNKLREYLRREYGIPPPYVCVLKFTKRTIPHLHVLLKLIMALIRPDSGEIWVDRENVVGMGEHGLSSVRKKLGYLFQDAALFDSFTLYENLALPLVRLTKKSKSEINELVQQTLTDVGLGHMVTNIRRHCRGV